MLLPSPRKAKCNPYAQRNVGKDNGRATTDDGGHLIASIFRGSGDLDNLVPMDSTLNRGGLEIVNVNIKYEGNSKRPSEFIVEYTIDGKYYSQNIVN